MQFRAARFRVDSGFLRAVDLIYSSVARMFELRMLLFMSAPRPRAH